MTITRQRARQIPRPVPAGSPAVRHDVLATWPDGGMAIKIASGIAIEAEARIRYRAAVEEAEATDEEATIILERVTVETLEIHEPGDEEIRLTDAPRDPFPAMERSLVASIARAFRVPLALLRRDPAEAFRSAPAPGASTSATPASLMTQGVEHMMAEDAKAARLREETLLKIATHYQGGHSSQGQMIATALKVPFPLTMPDLAIRALEAGFLPPALWPWWEAAPADLAAAHEHKRRREAPETTD
ncbi:MAG: hypothetical protein K2X91_04080 [Thermoleophilia bacterium]|nr:hypothetical protein [Thermoleophilia bacterium]